VFTLCLYVCICCLCNDQNLMCNVCMCEFSIFFVCNDQSLMCVHDCAYGYWLFGFYLCVCVFTMNVYDVLIYAFEMCVFHFAMFGVYYIFVCLCICNFCMCIDQNLMCIHDCIL
jgi:hypothetical protein